MTSLSHPHLENGTSWSCIEKQWSFLKSVLLEARELSTPKFKITHEASLRWYTSNIRHLIKQIKTLKKALKRSCTPTKAARLSTLEKSSQTESMQAKTEYETNLITSFSSEQLNYTLIWNNWSQLKLSLQVYFWMLKRSQLPQAKLMLLILSSTLHSHVPIINYHLLMSCQLLQINFIQSVLIQKMSTKFYRL